VYFLEGEKVSPHDYSVAEQQNLKQCGQARRFRQDRATLFTSCGSIIDRQPGRRFIREIVCSPKGRALKELLPLNW
jgi:hypothetical protein